MKREVAFVLGSVAFLLVLVLGVQLVWQTAQSQPQIPNELVIRPFVEIKFESPSDWKSEMRGSCVAYIPKGRTRCQSHRHALRWHAHRSSSRFNRLRGRL
jgi:hypothetical protein